MLIAILLLVFGAVALGAIVLAVVNPDRFLELFSFRYHRLCSIRSLFLQGKDSTPEWSTEYFVSQALRRINDQHAPEEIKEDLCKMLSATEYIDYYFSLPKFDIYAYKSMFRDYQSGAYQTKIYSIERRYRQILPPEIAKQNKALNMAANAYRAGWLDENGQPIVDDYKAAAIGSFIFSKVGLKRADLIWGEFWKQSDSAYRKSLDYFRKEFKDSDSFYEDMRRQLMS